MALQEIHKHLGTDQPKLKPGESLEGFPVLVAAPTYAGMQGEIVLSDTGATRKIHTYLNGSWYASTLT